jgi:hypothetical protein
MNTLTLQAGSAAPARRGLTRAIAAMATAVETVFELLVEAEGQSSAARNRFPFAD